MIQNRAHLTIGMVALWTFRKRAYDNFHITAIFDLANPYSKRQISGIFFPVLQKPYSWIFRCRNWSRSRLNVVVIVFFQQWPTCQKDYMRVYIFPALETHGERKSHNKLSNTLANVFVLYSMFLITRVVCYCISEVLISISFEYR